MLKKILAMLLVVTMLLAVTACGEGPKGDKGDPGEQGPKGDPGEGLTLVSLIKTGSAGLVDEWTMTFSNGETMKFTVTNGTDGKNGNDGVAPSIGDNGNWFIGALDTGVKAQGATGPAGPAGVQGPQGASGITPEIKNGTWWIGNTDTGVPASGGSGTGSGEAGKDGLTPEIKNGTWWIGDTDTGVAAQGPEGPAGTTPHIGDNGNWWIGTSDTGVYAGGVTAAKMTSIQIDSATSVSKTFKINFDDDTSIPFTVSTDVASKSQVVKAHDEAVANGYQKSLNSFIIDVASLAYKTLIIDGSPLDGKTLAIAMGKIMNRYNSYFLLASETKLVQQVAMDSLASINWDKSPSLMEIGYGESFEVNTELMSVTPGNILKVMQTTGNIYVDIIRVEWYDGDGQYVSHLYNNTSALQTEYGKEFPIGEGMELVRVGQFTSTNYDYCIEEWATEFTLSVKGALDVGAVNGIVNGTGGSGSEAVALMDVALDSETSDTMTFLLTYSDDTTSKLTVKIGGEGKAQVATAYETAADNGYSGTLSKWITDTVKLAFGNLVSDGSPLSAKTLGAAMSILMQEYDTYFTVQIDSAFDRKVKLEGIVYDKYNNSGQEYGYYKEHNDPAALAYNSTPISVKAGDIVYLVKQANDGSGNPTGAEAELGFRFWSSYNGDTYVSAGSGEHPSLGEKKYVTPAGVDGVKITFNYGNDTNIISARIYSNTVYSKATSALTVSAVNILVNGSAGGGAVELPKTIVSSVLGAVSITTTKDTLAGGSYLYLTNTENTVHLNKMITFKADLASALASGESILVGHGKSEAQASWIEITSTEVIVWYSDWGTPTEQARFTHGLNIEDYINVVIDNTSGENTAKITVATSGGSYTSTAARWNGRRGKIFAMSEDIEMSALTLRWLCDAYSQKIWMYGDSYFDTSYNARWPYYLKQAGFNNYMLSGYSGMGTSAALEQFKIDVTYGTPQYAVWCMGMNDPDPNATTVNENWLKCTEEFLAICEREGITPILATIPSTSGKDADAPGRFHYAKIEWVKNSGYRYIDFAHAVGGDRQNDSYIDEVNKPGAYWYDDMLSADGVHPAAKGAEALYDQFIVDFPEITKLK